MVQAVLEQCQCKRCVQCNTTETTWHSSSTVVGREVVIQTTVQPGGHPAK